MARAKFIISSAAQHRYNTGITDREGLVKAPRSREGHRGFAEATVGSCDVMEAATGLRGVAEAVAGRCDVAEVVVDCRNVAKAAAVSQKRAKG